MTPERRRRGYGSEPSNPPEPEGDAAEGPQALPDNTELSASEVFPEQEPGATAATYAAQTGDRSRYPGSVPDEEREAARREDERERRRSRR